MAGDLVGVCDYFFDICRVSFGEPQCHGLDHVRTYFTGYSVNGGVCVHQEDMAGVGDSCRMEFPAGRGVRDGEFGSDDIGQLDDVQRGRSEVDYRR